MGNGRLTGASVSRYSYCSQVIMFMAEYCTSTFCLLYVNVYFVKLFAHLSEFNSVREEQIIRPAVIINIILSHYI